MKTKNRIEINDLGSSCEFLIKTKGTPIIVILILGIVALIGFVMPPTIFISSLIFKFDLGFGFLFTILIGFGTAYYLTKLILWNTFGFEKVLISKGKLEYYCDFKYFKSNRKTILNNSLKAAIPVENGNENSFGHLRIESSSESIESQIYLPIILLNDLVLGINKRLEIL